MQFPDPQTEFCLSIGDVVMCKWSGEEECWDSKSNDPEDFPYAPQDVPETSETN